MIGRDSFIRIHNRLLINKEYRGFTLVGSMMSKKIMEKGGRKLGWRQNPLWRIFVSEDWQDDFISVKLSSGALIQLFKRDRGKMCPLGEQNEVDTARIGIALTTECFGGNWYRTP